MSETWASGFQGLFRAGAVCWGFGALVGGREIGEVDYPAQRNPVKTEMTCKFRILERSPARNEDCSRDLWKLRGLSSTAVRNIVHNGDGRKNVNLKMGR